MSRLAACNLASFRQGVGVCPCTCDTTPVRGPGCCRIDVGTESSVDRSKSIKSYLAAYFPAGDLEVGPHMGAPGGQALEGTTPLATCCSAAACHAMPCRLRVTGPSPAAAALRRGQTMCTAATAAPRRCWQQSTGWKAAAGTGAWRWWWPLTLLCTRQAARRAPQARNLWLALRCAWRGRPGRGAPTPHSRSTPPALAAGPSTTLLPPPALRA